MSLYDAIYAHLLQETSTATHFAGSPNRIFPLVIPQTQPRGAQKMPCVVFTTIAVERQQKYCGTDGLVRARVTLDYYAKTYGEVTEIAAAGRHALLDYKGLLGGVVFVRHASLDTELDVLDPEPGLYRVSQSWSFWHVE
jgi:hypothetical protein